MASMRGLTQVERDLLFLLLSEESRDLTDAEHDAVPQLYTDGRIYGENCNHPHHDNAGPHTHLKCSWIGLRALRLDALVRRTTE